MSRNANTFLGLTATPKLRVNYFKFRHQEYLYQIWAVSTWHGCDTAEPPTDALHTAASTWHRTVVSMAAHQEWHNEDVWRCGCPSAVIGSYRQGPVPAPAVANRGMDTVPAPWATTTGASFHRAAALSFSQGRQPRVCSWLPATLGSAVRLACWTRSAGGVAAVPLDRAVRPWSERRCLGHHNTDVHVWRPCRVETALVFLGLTISELLQDKQTDKQTFRFINRILKP